MDNAFDREENDDVAVYNRKQDVAPGIKRLNRSKTIVPKGGDIDQSLQNETESNYQSNAQRVTQMMKNQGKA